MALTLIFLIFTTFSAIEAQQRSPNISLSSTLTPTSTNSSISEGNHSSGLFRLKMQIDGNLVSYPLESPDTAPYSYFTSWTDGDGENITLNLAGNGHLYLFNTTGANIIKNITEGESSNDGKIYRMTLDVDGIFRVYSRTLESKGNWSVMWYSSADKCDPRGLCGLNGYCVQNDNEANCRCLPGFNFVNPKSWTLGCERDYAAVSCDTTNGSRTIKFAMEELDNMLWEDESYTVSELPNKEDCEQSRYKKKIRFWLPREPRKR